MRRLITVAAVIAGTFWAGAAFADPAAESVVAESAQPGPSNMEAGVYVGGFISNFYHQFYDTSDPAKSSKIEKLNSVAPQFSVRYAYFPHQNVGIEGEGSVSLEATESKGDSVTIYRL